MINKVFHLDRIALILTFILISSCTTKFKKAKELMAEKNYDEALILMNELILKDPSDTDYQVGLKEARLGVISQSLIKVRMTRLAQNNYESWELLRKVFEQQNQWNLFPTGAVAFTQTEEIDESYKLIKQEIQQLNRQNKPLRILYLIERYKMIFNETKRKTFESAFFDAKKNSQKYCTELAKISHKQTYYLNVFTSNLCRYLSVKTPSLESAPEMYDQVQSQINSRSNIPRQVATSFNEVLSSKLSQSGWIDSLSNKTMNIDISGDYFFRQIESREPRTHTYYEKIRTTNQNGTTSEREEPRFFNYSVNVVLQEFSTELSLTNNDPSLTTFHDAYDSSARRTYHDYSNYAINLRPESSGYSYTENEWQKIAIEQTANRYVSYLENAFDQKFCQTLSENLPRADLLNQSLKCIQQSVLNKKRKQPPVIVANIFNKEFAVDTQEFETLFKVVH